VPRLLDLAPNEEARKIFELMSVGADIGRPMLTTPGVPADRVKALRDAFAKTMADPTFREEAAKRDVEVDPTLGEELQELVEKMLQTDQKTVDLLAATLAKP
jgi:tripartite-type tricarboxylate transporter receptor subunit TctC